MKDSTATTTIGKEQSKKCKRSQMTEIWCRIRRNRLVILGPVIVSTLIIVAIFANRITDYNTVVIRQSVVKRLQGPSAEHQAGTDELGRDIFVHLIHDARISFLVGMVAVCIVLVTGGILGVIAGHLDGMVDNVIMRIMDIFLSIPTLPLAIMIVAALGPNMLSLMITTGPAGMPTFVWTARAPVLSVKDQEFVEATRATGAKNNHTILRYITPDRLSPIIAQVTLRVATAILSTASSSSISLGIQAPAPEWGVMLASGRAYIRGAPHIVITPGLLIMITILSPNLLGSSLCDALDLKFERQRGIAMDDYNTLPDIQNLSVEFRIGDGIVKVVNDMSPQIERGKTPDLAGETSAGKTTTVLSILHLIPDPPGVITGGSITLDGEDILAASKHQLEKMRGSLVSMISQDPMTSLNPMLSVDEQIAEVYILHKCINKQEAAKKAGEVLELVGIPVPRGRDYPHQFSGGMKQGVATATALVCSPKPLIVDESTTALDVTIQAQVLKLMKELKSKYDMPMLMITYDLGIVVEVCDEVSVMYVGRVAEHDTLEDIYEHTAHPYIEGLPHPIPNIDAPVYRLIPIPGLMSDPTDLPSGCPFAPRCSYAVKECSEALPATIQLSDTRSVSCTLRQKEE